MGLCDNRIGAMIRCLALLTVLFGPLTRSLDARALSNGSAVANAEAPAAPTARTKLFEALKTAASEAEARAAETAIWRFWMSAAPDSTSRRLIDQAMDRRGNFDFAGARQLLDQVVARAPTYAEAFNQRGFIRFLQDDLDGALEDVDRAIKLEPRHFGAMAGRVHILMRQGRFGLAQAQLREAVALHPFLKERAMLVPPADTAPEDAAGDEVDL